MPRRNRYQFEHPSEMPLPAVNANVFQPAPNQIQHIDSQNNRMLEEALKESLENHGLQEAKEESQQTAGDELFNQVAEQLPYLKPPARLILHLITGLDDIISHEISQPSPSNVTEIQRIQQTLQKALDTGETALVEETDAALSFIAGYDMESIKGAVYPRLESEIVRLQVEEAEAEAKEIQETEDEQIRQALEESIIEDAVLRAKAKADQKAEAEADTKTEAKTDVKEPTAAEKKANRLAALDRLEATFKAAKNQ